MITKINIDPRFNKNEFEDFLKSPVVVKVTNFTEESLTEFNRSFSEALNTGQPIIPIEIDSYGGGIHSLIGMISIIEKSPLPVMTICATKVMSAGAVLFSFGTEGYRYMHPDATMMIHDAAWGTGGKVEDMKIDTKYLDDINQQMFKRMSKHLGKQPNYIVDMIKTKNHLDWYISAKEAKKIGIVNHLALPTMEINVSLEIKIG